MLDDPKEVPERAPFPPRSDDRQLSADLSDHVSESSRPANETLPGPVNGTNLGDINLPESSSRAHKTSFKQIVKTAKDEERTAMYALRRLCDEVALRADYQLPKSAFPAEGLYRAYQIEALDRMPSRTKVAFVRAATRAAMFHHEIAGATESTMAKTFARLTDDEKLKIAQELLDYVKRRPAHAVGQQLLRSCLESCSKTRELRRLVTGLNPAELKRHGNIAVRNITAFVELGVAVAKEKPPGLLNQNAPSKVITRRMNDIRDYLDQLDEVVRTDPRNTKTRMGKLFIEIVKYNRELLQEMRGRLRGTKPRREFTNMLIRKLKLELEQGVLISSMRNDSYKHAIVWKDADMRQLAKMFKRLSGVQIACTPKLRQIRLEEELGELTYGQRDGTGLVRISAASIDAKDVSSQYHNNNSLQLVVLHELGHSFKFGRWGDGRNRKRTIEELADASSPIVDYSDFMSLSDWQVVEPEKFKLTNGRQSIRIDGKEYCLEDPTTFDEKRVIFRYDEGKKTLYHHDAEAQFPVQRYGRTNPWEDWTESFTDYIYAPARLIEFAPWKYVYMEQRFQIHRRNQELNEKLYRQLPELRKGEFA